MGKNDKGPSKKTQEKQQNKVIEDKTFGLKNKNKSAQVQKYVQAVQNSVKNNGMSQQKLMEMEQEKKKAQQKKEEEERLLASLFKTVTSVKGAEKVEEKEIDPKSQVCAFFKQGLCQKGKKCKFSHDLSLEQKSENIDLYTDQRTQLFGGNQTIEEEENCENWDVDKLNQVAKAQEQKYKNQKPTEIVCKFFLDAIEKGRYGWKWVCPNGMVCHYRHCLPPGYVLKKDVNEEKKVEEDLEEKLDLQIANLNHSNGTKVTLQIFLEWKKKRKERKEKEREEKRQEDVKKVQSKGKNHIMSGRALFMVDPNLFQDDEEAADDYEREESHHSDSEDNLDENGEKREKIKAPKQQYEELVFKEKEAGTHKPKGIQKEDETEIEQHKLERWEDDEGEGGNQTSENQESKNQKSENKKPENKNLENWEEGSEEEKKVDEEVQEQEKKKKKKKKQEDKVKVDDELFLE